MKVLKLTVILLINFVVISPCNLALAEEGGANASDPTASVNFTDIRYQTFDLEGAAAGRERDRIAIEGA